MARRVGLGVLAVAAVAVWWLMAPDSEETRRDFPGHYFDLVNTALEDASLNGSFADSAPQQQVVDGWVARDHSLPSDTPKRTRSTHSTISGSAMSDPPP